MNKIQETRLKLRSELEAPPLLRQFGSGWISGVLGFVLGLAAFLLVLSVRLEGLLSVPELRVLYESPWFRIALLAILLIAFANAALSLVLRQKKMLGGCAMALTLLASLIAGLHPAPVVRPVPLYFGLDFFVLNVLFTGFLFIPIERIFPRNHQPIFRTEYREDLFYYLVSSMLVQVLTFFTFLPAKSLHALAPMTEVRAWIAALPFAVQFLSIMLLTDFVQYWVHRTFHRVPALWKFHSVHHSARSMDWIAGARMHFIEILVLRSSTVIPMYILGFEPAAINAYVLTVYLYSTFIHANVGWKFPAIEQFLVTPRFHHWHHGIEPEAVDVNFAIHFPVYDRLFGTYYLPEGKWPAGYGVQGHPVPSGYLKQFRYPFRRA